MRSDPVSRWRDQRHEVRTARAFEIRAVVDVKKCDAFCAAWSRSGAREDWNLGKPVKEGPRRASRD